MGIQKRLTLSSVLPLLILITLASYFFIESYFNYEKSRALQHTLAVNQKLNAMLSHIQKERDLSALNLHSTKPTYLDILKKQYLHTDKVLISQSIAPLPKVQLPIFQKRFNSKRTDKYYDTVLLFKNFKKLHDQREKLTLKESTFEEIFFDGYTHKYIDKLLYHLARIKHYNLSPEITSLALTLRHLYKTKEASSQERGYVAYYINQQQPMDMKTYTTWQTIHNRAHAFKLDKLQTLKLSKKIKNLLNMEKSNAILENSFKESVQTQTMVLNGIYTQDVLQWFATQTNKISLLNKLELTFEDMLQNHNAQYKKKQTILLLISVCTLLLSFLLIYLWYRTAHTIDNNQTTLKSLLKRVIRERDTTHNPQLTSIKQIEDIDIDTQRGQQNAYAFLESIFFTQNKDKHQSETKHKNNILLLDNTNHDILTPLTHIAQDSEHLKNTKLNSGQYEFIQNISNHTQNLLHTIRSMHELSKIQSNTITVEEVTFNPYEVFESLIEMFTPMMTQKDIVFNFYMDPTISTTLKGDSNKVLHTLSHLIYNALNLTPKHGEINLQVNHTSTPDNTINKLFFSIQNTGKGLSEEERNKLIQAFTQADTSLLKHHDDISLDLTISKEYIKLLGGMLEVESALEYGSTFFFSLQFESISFDTFKETQPPIDPIALYTPKNRGKLHSFLRNYFTYFKVEIFEFNTIEVLKALLSHQAISKVWVDYDRLEPKLFEEITACLTSEQLVLLVSATHKKEVKSYTKKNIQILFKPLTPTKLFTHLYSPLSAGGLTNVVKESNINVNAATQVHKDTLTTSQNNIVKAHKLQTNKKKILLAKRYALENRILARTLSDLDERYDILDDIKNLSQAMKSGDYDIVFTNTNVAHTPPDVTIVDKTYKAEEIKTLLQIHRKY